MTSLLSRVALLVGRRPRATTLAVVVAVVAIIGAAIAAGSTFKDDFTVPGIESQKAQDLLEQRFPAQSGAQATIVFTGKAVDHSGGKRRIGTVLATVGRQPHVVSVEDPYT